MSTISAEEVTETALVPAAPTTPTQLLRIAVEQGADIDKLAKLMDLQERWERNEARKAFVVAMSEFKSGSIQVLRDKDNKQYNSRYVSLGRLVEIVTPFLGKSGLSVRWDLDQSNGITVTCVVTHTAGHSESVSMIVPPDKSGSKNPLQEIKSAITYARACTFECACGLASTDANRDDDGNGAGGKGAGISEDRVREHCEWIANAKDMKEMLSLYKNGFMEAQKANNRAAMDKIIAAKDQKAQEF